MWRVLHSISTGYAGLLGCILKHRWKCTYLLSEHGIYTKERKIFTSLIGTTRPINPTTGAMPNWA